MEVTVLMENTTQDPRLTAEHGLSLYIEYRDRAFLLDTGSTGDFAVNADRLGISLEPVEACFLSHGHYDHAGGLAAFLDRNPRAPVYAMESATRPYYSGDGEHRHPIGIPQPVLRRLPGRLVPVGKLTRCRPGIWLLPHSTPGLEAIGAAKKLYREEDGVILPDDFSHEMTVIFETSAGLILCNSCCHGGLETVLREVAGAFPGRKLYAFLGGLHMRGKKNGEEICTFSPPQLEAVAAAAARYGLEAVYTGHCTGGAAYRQLAPLMGNRLRPLTTGLTLLLPD